MTGLRTKLLLGYNLCPTDYISQTHRCFIAVYRLCPRPYTYVQNQFEMTAQKSVRADPSLCKQVNLILDGNYSWMGTT